MLEWFLSRAQGRGASYDTVRAAFLEGGAIFPGSGLQRETHVEVAVRNGDCILGVFRPTL